MVISSETGVTPFFSPKWSGWFILTLYLAWVLKFYIDTNFSIETIILLLPLLVILCGQRGTSFEPIRLEFIKFPGILKITETNGQYEAARSLKYSDIECLSLTPPMTTSDLRQNYIVSIIHRDPDFTGVQIETTQGTAVRLYEIIDSALPRSINRKFGRNA